MKQKAVRSLLALLLAAALILASVPALADGGTGSYYMVVRTGNTGKLHLRALPTSASQSLGLFANGTQVLVESVSNNWAFVTVNGQKGYMSLSFLAAVSPSPVNPPAQTEDTTLYVRTGNSGKLHMREYASQNARSLGLYPNGTAVRVTARSGAWAYVTVSGVSGYMMLQFLSATAPSQPVNPDPAVNPGTASVMYVRTGNSGRLHLREYASQSARSLGLFANGTQVYAVPLGNGWCQVVVNGQSGYMMSQFLTGSQSGPDPVIYPVPDGAVPYWVRTGNTGKLHLRAAMSTESISLGLYPNGTQVYVLSNLGTWAYVNVGGRQGYMMTRFLTANGSGTPAPGPVVPSGTAIVRQPNNSFVYLRTSKSSASIDNVICQVPSGTEVTVVEWGELWTKIRYDGMEGYMVTHYLK